MALDLSNTLVIGISSTALFDMSESDSMFNKLYEENKDIAIKKYRAFMFKNEDKPLKQGTGYPLVKALLNLNNFKNEKDAPLVEVIIMSRNSPSEMRVIKTLRHWGVYVDEAFFLGGVDKGKVLKAFRAHIFFDDQDVHLDVAANVISSGKVPYASNSKLKALANQAKSV